MRQTVLVIGDPLMGIDQLAAPAEALFSDRYEVRRVTWDATLADAVAMNRTIELNGPAAVGAELVGDEDLDDDAVVGIIVQFFPLSQAVLSRWPNLRAVATMRAGTENIDLDELARRDIAFVPNAGRNANAVAEMTVALMLATMRDLGEGHRSVRNGDWRPPTRSLGMHELAGRRLAIVGYGAVGRLVQRRLAGFELDVVVVDPFVDEQDLDGARVASLDEAVRSVDIVSLHVRSSPQTRGMLDADRLRAMSPSSILVNTARADLLDEDALVQELRDGTIGGAGLDVFSVEPLPVDHPLRSMPNVTLTPHLAGVTVEARSRAPHLVAANLQRLLEPVG